jgi:hypothetical protein
MEIEAFPRLCRDWSVMFAFSPARLRFPLFASIEALKPLIAEADVLTFVAAFGSFKGLIVVEGGLAMASMLDDSVGAGSILSCFASSFLYYYLVIDITDIVE